MVIQLRCVLGMCKPLTADFAQHFVTLPKSNRGHIAALGCVLSMRWRSASFQLCLYVCVWRCQFLCSRYLICFSRARKAQVKFVAFVEVCQLHFAYVMVSVRNVLVLTCACLCVSGDRSLQDGIHPTINVRVVEPNDAAAGSAHEDAHSL